MSSFRIRTGTIMSAAALSLGLLAAAGAPAASAAAAAPAAVTAQAAASLGACNILLEGQIRYLGGKPYICKHFPGVGYIWIRYYNSCSAPASRLAGLTC